MSVSGLGISGPSANPSVYSVGTGLLGGTMKRLMILMLACAAILVMGIAAAAVRAEGGNDDERGGAGDDNLQGDRGADDLNGGKGDDHIDGGPGNDVINSRDGQRDVVNCGSGFDRVRADHKDRIAKNCESVKRS